MDIDSNRADTVNVREAGPDNGNLVPYHNPIPDIKTFSIHLDVDNDCVINSDFPEVNFNGLYVKKKEGDVGVLTFNANQSEILRWYFSKCRNLKVTNAGLLDLTTQSVHPGGNYVEVFDQYFEIEFNKIRVIKILDGDSLWDQNTVT